MNYNLVNVLSNFEISLIYETRLINFPPYVDAHKQLQRTLLSRCNDEYSNYCKDATCGRYAFHVPPDSAYITRLVAGETVTSIYMQTPI